MVSRRPTELGVFFPWEQRRGLVGVFGRRRARGVLVALLFLLASIGVYQHGERASSVRSTRATLATVHRALSAYRADHAGACPRNLVDLESQGYTHTEPVDAWGRHLRLECPGRKDPLGYDISSDGPDGQPGGLDQVE
jgi:general secretion pathway protein G